MTRLFFALLLWSLTNTNSLIAQDRCGTTDGKHYHEHIHQFENWLSGVRKRSSQRVENTLPYVIPVVVHIIHNGEAIGSGTNLSDEKIIEQIDILNADFRRTNADAVNTRADFLPLAVDTEISFVLALQDPEGLPTDGITRTQGPRLNYQRDDDALLKSVISWPADEYLNIYVADLATFLGWAQFPLANLDGLDGEFDPNESTDGIVVDYTLWGLNDNAEASFDSFGRTATHEMGHFLGLRHIWGDGGCSVDDFCDDTPLAGTSTRGCPDDKATCGSQDMVENYMDFTDDVCMNMFTSCQKSRMLLVLENSPRRKTLVNSRATQAPQQFANDLGIRSADFFGGSDCNTEILPRVTLRNYGTEVINGFEIELVEDGTVIETISRDITLAPLAITNVNFSLVTPGTSTGRNYAIRIKELTGVTDDNGANDEESMDVFIPAPVSLPYEESFDVFPNSTWSTSANAVWESATAAFNSSTDVGVRLPYFSTDEEQNGQQDFLISPVFDLSNPDFASLSFRYAYAKNSGEFTDGLIVAISTDCGQTFPRQQYIFESYGTNLSTSPTLSQEFGPISAAEWKEVNLNLGRFVGNEIRIAFIGSNGSGNNIYLDEVKIGSTSSVSLDAALGELEDFSIASCFSVDQPSIQVINNGITFINDLEIAVGLNDQVIGIIPVNQANISTGSSRFLTLPINLPLDGFGRFTLEIRSVNGQEDDVADNNFLETYLIVDRSEDTIPLREDFDNNENFTQISSFLNDDWANTEATGSRVIFSRNFSQTILGKENWLVSPTLNVEELAEGSMTFDVSYAQRGDIVDGLRVMLSKDCGFTWDEVLYNKRGSLLATVAQSNEEWFPRADSDWRTETIDLTPYISDPFTSTIRIALVTTNGNGNNIFLDNIEVFPSASPNTVDNDQEMTVFPNPSTGRFSVAMDLPTKEEITLHVVDLSGRVIKRYQLSDVLNQRFEIDIPNLEGVYLVNARGEKTNLTRRILIGR